MDDDLDLEEIGATLFGAVSVSKYNDWELFKRTSDLYLDEFVKEAKTYFTICREREQGKISLEETRERVKAFTRMIHERINKKLKEEGYLDDEGNRRDLHKLK
jgi:hypothetical protein